MVAVIQCACGLFILVFSASSLVVQGFDCRHRDLPLSPRIFPSSRRSLWNRLVDQNEQEINSVRVRRQMVVVAGITTYTTATSATRLSMMEGGWESIVFHAESLANDWAGKSLAEDPSHLITSLPIMYGAGLLTSLSPCVWGLLPLTISYISAAAGERQDQRTTLPTLAFAAGLAAVFCTLGVTAAQLGEVFGGAASSTESNGVNSSFLLPLFSNTICLAMGLQLLGFLLLPLPSLDFLKKSGMFGSSSSTAASEQLILIDGTGQVISKNSNKKNQKNEQGSLFRTFLLGGSSALVASPCATPVLTSILAFVAKAPNSDPGLGALLLFGYTLGYSTPLLLIAATGGQALVNFRQRGAQSSTTGGGGGGWYGSLAPWVTPITGGILLWYGTNGLLTTLLGDPSMAGLVILE